jgi:hypothetical protein
MITCRNVTYNRSVQSPCSARVTGRGGLSKLVRVVYAGDHTNAGPNVVAAATFAGDRAHLRSTASTSFVIAKVLLTRTVTVASKAYDGTTAARIAACVLSGVIAGDSVTCDTSHATATFAAATPGSALAVGVTGLALGGPAAGDYALSSAGAAPTGSITKAIVTPTVTANNKTYDGTTTGSIGTCTLAPVIAADANNVSCDLSGATATFASANVGNAIGVSVAGLGLTGSAAGNYQLSATSQNTTANISLDTTVTPTVTVANKTYDGTTSAAITGCTLAGVKGTDNVTCTTSGATATFVSSGVGTGVGVNVTGLALGGTAATNYQLASTSATSSANITPATLTPTVTVANKTYDGTTSAAITGCTLATVVASDAGKVACDTTGAAAAFVLPNVGTGILVNVTGLALTGTAAGNYGLSSTSAATAANITLESVTVTAGSQALEYGAALPAIGYTTQPATSAADWTSQPTCAVYGSADTGFTTPLSGVQGAGTYVTHCSGGSSSNVSASAYTDGTVTISPATLYVVPNSQSILYGSPVPGALFYTFTLHTVFAGGPGVASIQTAPTCGSTYGTTTPAAVYSGGITCAGGSDPNYILSYVVTANLTVAQVPVAVTADSTSISSTTAIPPVGYTTAPTTSPSDWTTEPACAVYASTDTTYSSPLTGTVSAATYVTHCTGGVSTDFAPTSYANGTLTVTP